LEHEAKIYGSGNLVEGEVDFVQELEASRLKRDVEDN